MQTRIAAVALSDETSSVNMPLVLVENERTAGGRYDSWQDLTGSCYHFPNAYRSLVKPGERFVYYRGVRQAVGRRPNPEYFGCGVIDAVWRDISIPEESPRRVWKWFCSIKLFTRFDQPVPWMEFGQTLENIPRNLFGNGVRRISDQLFDHILARGNLRVDVLSAFMSASVEQRDEERISAFLEARRIGSSPQRVELALNRVVRDTKLVRLLKELYANSCQICGESLLLPGGRYYSEGHHVKPLGQPHNGPDIASNLLILCPNHHVLCDLGAIVLNPAVLRIHPLHALGPEYIEYHNEIIVNSAAMRFAQSGAPDLLMGQASRARP